MSELATHIIPSKQPTQSRIYSSKTNPHSVFTLGIRKNSLAPQQPHGHNTTNLLSYPKQGRKKKTWFYKSSHIHSNWCNSENTSNWKHQLKTPLPNLLLNIESSKLKRNVHWMGRGVDSYNVKKLPESQNMIFFFFSNNTFLFTKLIAKFYTKTEHS